MFAKIVAKTRRQLGGLPFLLGLGWGHRRLDATELTGEMKPSLSGNQEAPSMSVVAFRLHWFCFGLC
jgi:hypothetical protein